MRWSIIAISSARGKTDDGQGKNYELWRESSNLQVRKGRGGLIGVDGPEIFIIVVEERQ